MMHALLVIVFIIVAVSLWAWLSNRSAPEAVVVQALKDGARVIDVRTVREYNGGHYPGSVNIPVNQISARSKTLGDTSKTVIVYCHSGMRSASARKLLLNKGFKNVINAGSYHHIMRLTSKKK